LAQAPFGNRVTNGMPAVAVPVLAARDVSKRFGSVVALEHIDFEVYPGEIVALIGDNGAGKSTLIKILSGTLAPDSGTLLMRGKPVHFSSPRDAREAGIETVYQDLALAPDLDVPGNLFLGRELRRSGLLGILDILDVRGMRARAQAHLDTLGVKIKSVDQRVDTLSGGQRQSVAVSRSVFWGRDVVIMDEPTAALSVAQAALVIGLIKRVRDAGTPVVLISHNLPHVFEASDRMIVLRHGSRVGTLDPKTATMENAVSLMTGALGAVTDARDAVAREAAEPDE
jgi:fructose transport system ATP-binding protein